jgi:hypothetical protein
MWTIGTLMCFPLPELQKAALSSTWVRVLFLFAVFLLIQTVRTKNSVVDPDSLNPDTDPDPAFQVTHPNSVLNPDHEFLLPKIAKNTAKNYLFDQKLQLIISRPP